MIEQSLTTEKCAIVTSNGLMINGHIFDSKLMLEHYVEILGAPGRSIDAGPPAPFGHRNNQIHLFDPDGIYLTEHHSSRLIESVNFIFDPSESPFQIEKAFGGSLEVEGQSIRRDMPERSMAFTSLNRDLPGEYSLVLGRIWVGISAKGRRDIYGKRMQPRFIVRVSICF
ncbi:MAG: hypothetical protein FJ308_14760 [Planctomycetes bacterium]|nr:hypothetical protein [Planctomycetota bacterium]